MKICKFTIIKKNKYYELKKKFRNFFSKKFFKFDELKKIANKIILEKHNE